MPILFILYRQNLKYCMKSYRTIYCCFSEFKDFYFKIFFSTKAYLRKTSKKIKIFSIEKLVKTIFCYIDIIRVRSFQKTAQSRNLCQKRKKNCYYELLSYKKWKFQTILLTFCH